MSLKALPGDDEVVADGDGPHDDAKIVKKCKNHDCGAEEHVAYVEA